MEGISVLDAEYLIPFKMYAWLDLKERKANGEHVNEKDLKKHKYDVFRLLQIADRSKQVTIAGLVREKTERFLKEIAEENIPFEQLDIPLDMQMALEILNALYLR